MHPTQPMAALGSSVRSLWLAVGQSDMFVNSFCRPDQFDEWSKISNQLARFTPCFTDVVILTSAHVVMIVMCIVRLRLLKSLPPSKRYRANSRPVLVARVLGAAYCALIPILQLGARLSLATAGTEPLAPFEIFALIAAALAWAVTSHTFYMERCIYVREGAWYTRLAVLYVLSGNLAKLQFVWLLIGENSKVFFYFFLSNVAVNSLLGLFALFWFPPLEKSFQSDEHPEEEAGTTVAEGAAYMPLADEAPIDADTSVCPERKANFISRLLFSWITPVMAVGYKRPLQDPDVWQLDTWDRTDTIADQFNRCWEAELKRGKPSLLRALHKAFGGRFWIGGIYKIGNDASQFVGPVFLNLLLAAMQNGEPSWKGYLYGVSIFVGLMLGVLCEGQYFQNVMRVGFRLRTAIIAAVFRKSLHLSFRGRQSFSAGRITNMMTSDAEALQQVLQSLHNLWSAPVRIIIACVLLYGALGIASIVSLLVLLLMIPTQAIVVTTVQRLVKQTLQRTDKRVDLIQELLAAMDIVKFYAWEHSFEKKVENIREEELSWLRKSAVVSAFNMFLLNVVPVLVSVVAFSVYAWLGNELTPAKAFSSIALFNVLRFPLYTFPQLISQVINAMVSVRRLEDLLIAEERQLEANPPTDPTKPAIVVKDTDFAWDPKTHEPTLHSVSLEIPAGSLTAIVGGTGQGKSSLVAALLGEMPTMESGALEDHMNGRMAYVPQSSWIFNATIRDNILFGLPYNRSRYEEALRVSQLVRDLELLPGGDLTEIGERGVNVSGGQKQRISIARAVYADADVYFFDDPLSALDAHVGKQVFDECIRGALDGRTRVMVTNQLHFLRHVDNVLLIKDGTIVERGTFDELKANGKEFQHLLEQAGSMEEEDEETDPKKKAAGKVAGEKAVGAVVAQSDAKQAKTEDGKPEAGGTHLIKEEERATGLVRADVIWRYVAAMGGTSMLVLLLAFFIVVEIARVGASLWLSVWSGAGRHPPHSVAYYIGIYAGISSGQMLLTLANQLFLALIGIIAARALHNAMLHTVLRAPMVFFQSTPLGRLINRFTKDIADVDKNLIQYTAMFLRGFFQLFSTFALIAFLTPFALTVITPLLFAFYMLYLYFQSTAREVKRLDSITRSPVYAQFGEALSGLPTIRAYRAHDRLAAINGRAVDLNTRYTLVNMSANRWLSIRLEFLGGLMILATAIFAVLGQGNTDADARAKAAPQIGLILSYALSITSLMTMTLRLASLFENSFNSVERIGEYTEIPPEGPEVIPDHRPPPGWPDKGAIEFKDVVMRYRPELPPVLKGLTVSIKPAEKVGVVGRTGAGKSTIFNTLFRMVEIESGEIDIDGINIATIGLADLRRKLSIIPQTPVLFTGTIRFNLDPFNEHPDGELWEALERAHLKPVIAKSPLGLDTEVTEGGENFSVGQRQLVSLARALVRRSKILVLDEATAAVDIATDSLIQKTIREEFKNCTLLTIAHRLNTIIDSDRILVLDDGRAVEFDSAAKLLKNKGGLFYSLVQSTGSANAHYLERIASGSMDAKEEREQHAKEGKRKLDRESVSRKWMSATRWALAKALAQSTGDLQKSGPVSESVRDAVSLLRGVLQGERREEIAAELEQLQVSEERWYQALVRVVESLATMGRQLRTRLTDGGEKDDLWSTVAFAYDQTDQ